MSGVPRGLARHVGHDPPERVPVAVDRDNETRLRVADGTDRAVAVLDCRPVVGQHVGRGAAGGGRPCRIPGRRPRRPRRGGSRTSTAPPRPGAGSDQGRRCRCRPGRGVAAHQTVRRPPSARSAGRTTETPGPCRARPSRRVARAPAGSQPSRHGNPATRSNRRTASSSHAGCRALLMGSMILAQAGAGLALTGPQALARPLPGPSAQRHHAPARCARIPRPLMMRRARDLHRRRTRCRLHRPHIPDIRPLFGPGLVRRFARRKPRTRRSQRCARRQPTIVSQVRFH